MKSLAFEVEESTYEEISKIAKIYHKNVTDLLKESVEKLIGEKKSDLYYKMLNVPESSQEEADEIMEILNNLSDDDKEIVEKKTVKL